MSKNNNNLSTKFNENTSTNFSFNDGTLQNAINTLDQLAPRLLELNGTPKDPDEFQKYVKEIITLETQAKATGASNWRAVVDLPIHDGQYKDPQVQFSSPAPHYERVVATFSKDNGLEVEHVDTSVNPNVDLSQILSPHGVSLQEIKDIYNAAGIHRIAILGGARVFPSAQLKPEVFNSLTEDEQLQIKGGLEPSNLSNHTFTDNDYLITPSNAQWASEKNAWVENQLNHLLNVYEATGKEFVTVNGGWRGQEEGSTGMTLISNLFGSVASANHGHSLPPVTIMPEGGAFDRVFTSADATYKHDYPMEQVKDSTSAHTYFEIPGVWGDDSPYLIGFSTGAMVFSPYGFWTNIEVANAVAAHKPVAIIVHPDDIKAGGQYENNFLNNTYFEKEIELPDGTIGHARIYNNALDASAWLYNQSELSLHQNDTVAVGEVNDII